MRDQEASIEKSQGDICADRDCHTHDDECESAAGQVFKIGEYPRLELSTQLVVAEAQRRGHRVEILDEKDNFIRVTGNGKIEYIKQATRTSADSYIAPLIMENKNLTKLILAECGIAVPEGKIYHSPDAAKADLPRWKKISCVVKPNTTNFGTAVSMMKLPFSEEDFAGAVDAAFKADSSVIVERMIPGDEFRFLVIGGRVRAVLHRVPANVVGDSVHTIEELVAIKNRSPLRGKGYVTPLERLQLGSAETEFLREHNIDRSHVPPASEKIFLRRNSNISTGGDSIDFTDTMHQSYKDIACAAAAAAGAKICGVDMIVGGYREEATGDSYSVIELNFNPALHIHDFPFEGNNREVEKHLLDLLDL